MLERNESAIFGSQCIMSDIRDSYILRNPGEDSTLFADSVRNSKENCVFRFIGSMVASKDILL